MTEKKYPGIDRFRMIAALLVVAIHKSPLALVDPTADFILTGVVARVAVPFFFMVSGFFMDARKPWAFIKKTAIIYAAAIILYLPLNVYHGIPMKWTSLGGILKDIFFDGTYLHLWYLPAAMTAAFISWLLLKRFKKKGALIIALTLYAVGLLGDSYYGFTEKLPALKSFYEAVFSFSSYTRNGLFFAPVFFILGAISRREKRYELKTCLAGMFISLCLMIAEGLLLRAAGVQRHDSMYIMLIPCMLFLFRSLLLWNGKSQRRLRDMSAVVYIVHPISIAFVYKFAALAQLQWLSGNSIIRYLAVCAVSLAAAALFAILPRGSKQEEQRRVWAEIDIGSLVHNVRALRGVLPRGCDIMAVVKADAYGHGDVETARALSREGVSSFAVATIDEGLCLRRNGIRGEILILGYTGPKRAAELSLYRLTQTIVDYDYALELERARKFVRAHIKVDTGMHRLGESWEHVSRIEEMFKLRHIKIVGIFTHECVSDSAAAGDVEFTRMQERRFGELLEKLKDRGIDIPKTHVQSSYGVLGCSEGCACVRTGLALYGAVRLESGGRYVDLKPVLALKARVSLVRTIAAGESAGYGRAFTASRDTRIAVLPVGYADGVPRSMSNGNGYVLLRGRRAPIVGSICMDQLMIDVTDIPGAARGDIATLIGADGHEEITAVKAAKCASTIPNELLSRLGGRIERVYIYENVCTGYIDY